MKHEEAQLLTQVAGLDCHDIGKHKTAHSADGTVPYNVHVLRLHQSRAQLEADEMLHVVRQCCMYNWPKDKRLAV